MASSSLTTDGLAGFNLGIEGDEGAEPPVALAENVRGAKPHRENVKS